MTVLEAVRLREQAGSLLNRLISDRESSERRLAESGKRDPMKFITGQTALDGAIASARELIGNMDALLANMQIEFDAEDLARSAVATANGWSNSLTSRPPHCAEPVHANRTPIPVASMP